MWQCAQPVPKCLTIGLPGQICQKLRQGKRELTESELQECIQLLEFSERTWTASYFLHVVNKRVGKQYFWHVRKAAAVSVFPAGL
jgi:hypothetical protein